MKRLAALSLACTMAMGCFAGCGGDSKVSSSDEKAFVKSYLKATYDEPDGYVHYTSTAPAGAIEAAKASGEWDKKVNEYTGHFFMDSTASRYIPESVEKVADISDRLCGNVF